MWLQALVLGQDNVQGRGSKHPVRGLPRSRTDSAGRGSSSLRLGPSLEKSRPSDVSRTATALPCRLVRCHIRTSGKSHRGKSNTPCSEAREDRKTRNIPPNRTTSQVAKAGRRRVARPSPSIVGLVVQAGALASGYGSHRTTFPRTPRAALGPGRANQTSRRTPGGPLADAGSWHQGAAPLPWDPLRAGPGTTARRSGRGLRRSWESWASRAAPCSLWVRAVGTRGARAEQGPAAWKPTASSRPLHDVRGRGARGRGSHAAVENHVRVSSSGLGEGPLLPSARAPSLLRTWAS